MLCGVRGNLLGNFLEKESIQFKQDSHNELPPIIDLDVQQDDADKTKTPTQGPRRCNNLFGRTRAQPMICGKFFVFSIVRGACQI